MCKLNLVYSIEIGEYCWIGRKAYVGKGVRLQPDTIVGVYGVVTKPYEESNIVVAGNPAEIKKHNVTWK